MASPCPTCGAPVRALSYIVCARSPLTSSCRTCGTALRIEQPWRLAAICLVFAVVLGAAGLWVARGLGPAPDITGLVLRCVALAAAAGLGMALGHQIAWIGIRLRPAVGAPWGVHAVVCALGTMAGLGAAWLGLTLGLS